MSERDRVRRGHLVTRENHPLWGTNDLWWHVGDLHVYIKSLRDSLAATEKVVKFARHRPECPLWQTTRPQNFTCDCGYDEALAALDTTPKGGEDHE